MISSGVISLIIGMLPAMKMTEPYSPSARAKASAKPVSSAGVRIGKITFVKVCQRFAPSVAPQAFLDLAICRSSSTGCTVRTTKGRTDEGECHEHAQRRERHLERQPLADPAVAGVQRRQRDARHCRGQRERQVDQRIDDALGGNS